MRSDFRFRWGPALLLALASLPARGASSPDSLPPAALDPARVFPVSQAAKPGYLQPRREPTFGTRLERVGNDAGLATAPVNGTWGADTRHVYSKQQPWSSDESLISIENRSGGSPTPLILDGTSYAPKLAPCPNYDLYDYRWHPSPAHPHEQINVNSSGNELMWFDVTTCTKTRTWTLPVAANYGIGSGEEIGRAHV